MKEIRKLIREEVETLIRTEEYSTRFRNHLLITEMFDADTTEVETLPETEKSKEDALQKIKNEEWDTVPTHFKEAISKSKRKEVLTDYSVAELEQMKLFKVKGYDMGYALKKHNGSYSEIVSVFNNEPSIKGMGVSLVKSAIKNGGCYLDHFDGFLSDLYSSLGFIEIGRDPYNPKYDTGGVIKAKYGEVDVVYRKYKGC